eukprot:Partr_v1_DN25541_c0_g1_i7_m20654
MLGRMQRLKVLFIGVDTWRSSLRLELNARLQQLDISLARSEKRTAEMSKAMSKLSHFKQSVLDSFEEDDYGDIRRKLLDKQPSRTMSPVLPPSADVSAAFASSKYSKYGGAGDYSTNIADYVPPSGRESRATNVQSRPPAAPISVDFQSTSYAALKEENAAYSSLLGDSRGPTTTSNGAGGYARQQRQAPPQQKSSSRNHILDSADSVANNATDTAQSNGSLDVDNNGSGSNVATVDGREYFRKAKSVLSYDEFTNLLWNVKAYNSRDQSRVKTLESVHESIGKKHPEMYLEFEKLLSR